MTPRVEDGIGRGPRRRALTMRWTTTFEIEL
jgi:hypothetical protein